MGRMKKERGADTPFHAMEPGSLKADVAFPFQDEHLFLGKVGGKTKNDLIYCSGPICINSRYFRSVWTGVYQFWVHLIWVPKLGKSLGNFFVCVKVNIDILCKYFSLLAYQRCI